MNEEWTTDWELLPAGNNGDFIYHYTTYEVFLQHILLTKKLKLSPITGTNDPYEFKFRFPIARHQYSIPDSILSPFYGQYENLIKRKCALISFSSDSHFKKIKRRKLSGRGFADPQMWAHYAARHKGICLVFDKKLISESARQSLITSTNYIFDDFVIYKDMENEFDPEPNIDRAREIGSEKYVEEHVISNRQNLFFRKDEAWKNEREFRIIAIGKSQNTFFIDISKAICGVVFGCEYPYRFVTDYETIKRDFCPHLRRILHAGIDQTIKSI